jgi:hypothetical protein
MKHTIIVFTDRSKYLLELLGDKAQIVEQYIDEYQVNWTKLEITIEDSIDLMHVFHAGCKTAMDSSK